LLEYQNFLHCSFLRFQQNYFQIYIYHIFLQQNHSSRVSYFTFLQPTIYIFSNILTFHFYSLMLNSNKIPSNSFFLIIVNDLIFQEKIKYRYENRQMSLILLKQYLIGWSRTSRYNFLIKSQNFDSVLCLEAEGQSNMRSVQLFFFYKTFLLIHLTSFAMLYADKCLIDNSI